MLTVPQIEALRRTNPQLYEALKRLAGASLGPNQGWSLDDQITDGTNYARVVTGALTAGQIDPTKSGVLMKGSVPPTWSGAFTYVSTTSSITWSWSGLTILRADGTSTAIPNGSVAVASLAAGTTYYFYPYWDETAAAIVWVAGGAGTHPAFAGRHRRGDHHQRHRRRLGRRQRKLRPRGHRRADEGTRHGRDRDVQGRRAPALPFARGRRNMDAHPAPRGPRRGHVPPAALFE